MIVPMTGNARIPRLTRDALDSLNGANITIACAIKIDAFGRMPPQFPVAQKGQCGTPGVWTLQ